MNTNTNKSELFSDIIERTDDGKYVLKESVFQRDEDGNHIHTIRSSGYPPPAPHKRFKKYLETEKYYIKAAEEELTGKELIEQWESSYYHLQNIENDLMIYVGTSITSPNLRLLLKNQYREILKVKELLKESLNQLGCNPNIEILELSYELSLNLKDKEQIVYLDDYQEIWREFRGFALEEDKIISETGSLKLTNPERALIEYVKVELGRKSQPDQPNNKHKKDDFYNWYRSIAIHKGIGYGQKKLKSKHYQTVEDYYQDDKEALNFISGLKD